MGVTWEWEDDVGDSMTGMTAIVKEQLCQDVKEQLY